MQSQQRLCSWCMLGPQSAFVFGWEGGGEGGRGVTSIREVQSGAYCTSASISDALDLSRKIPERMQRGTHCFHGRVGEGSEFCNNVPASHGRSSFPESLGDPHPTPGETRPCMAASCVVQGKQCFP